MQMKIESHLKLGIDSEPSSRSRQAEREAVLAEQRARFELYDERIKKQRKYLDESDESSGEETPQSQHCPP